MGQRTQIITVAESLNGEAKVRIYHLQWGQGNKMPMCLVDIINKAYDFPYRQNMCEYDFLPSMVPDYTECFENGKHVSGEIGEDLEKYTESSSIGQIIKKWCDNNNGAMVVYLKEYEGEYQTEVSVKYGFLMGTEDEHRRNEDGEEYDSDTKEYGKAFEKWLNLSEWRNIPVNRYYIDEDREEAYCVYYKSFDAQCVKEESK